MSKILEAKTCSPFDSHVFLNYMRRISQAECKHCLPDCIDTIYDSAVTAAPFRRCDYKNLGLSELCSLDTEIQPQIWAENLLVEYESKKDPSTKNPIPIPTYISKLVGDRTNRRTNKRSYVPTNGDDKDQIVFTVQNERYAEYDAYEKDMATVTFFYDSATAFVYERKASMTWVGFISQVGGLFGLCMGFSFISVIEIGYWLTVRMFKNTLE